MPRFIRTEGCGSYYQDCEVLSERIPFDLQKHGSAFDKLMSTAFPKYKSSFADRYGYEIEYFDFDISANVIEWVSEEKVEI